MEREVSTDAPEPLHYQLQDIFKEKIDGGEWLAGHQIDSEVKLCERYGVSRATMRQAILSLVAKGLLVRKQGLGTFVAVRKHDFSAVAPRLPNDPEARHELLTVDVDTKDAEIAPLLNVSIAARLTKLERLRYLEDEPLSIEVSWVPSMLCPGIEDLDLSRPLVDILRQEFGIDLVRRSATIEPVMLDDRQRKLLRPTADPALGLLVTRTGYTSEDQPMSVNKTVFRGDRYRARID